MTHPWKTVDSQADIFAKQQAEREAQQSQYRQLQERKQRFEDASETVFDLVTQQAGGAPVKSASGLIWQMVMDERLPCEGIAQVVIDKGLVAVDPQARIDDALDTARRYGGIDGDHHKDWTIDQMCRVLAGEKYRDFVKEACDGENGPDTYHWDVGTPP